MCNIFSDQSHYSSLRNLSSYKVTTAAVQRPSIFYPLLTHRKWIEKGGESQQFFLLNITKIRYCQIILAKVYRTLLDSWLSYSSLTAPVCCINGILSNLAFPNSLPWREHSVLFRALQGLSPAVSKGHYACWHSRRALGRSSCPWAQANFTLRTSRDKKTPQSSGRPPHRVIRQLQRRNTELVQIGPSPRACKKHHGVVVCLRNGYIGTVSQQPIAKICYKSKLHKTSELLRERQCCSWLEVASCSSWAGTAPCWG